MAALNAKNQRSRGLSDMDGTDPLVVEWGL